MKLALVGQERLGATPGQVGSCPSCGSPTVAKCGRLRVWHWAHHGQRHCDPWWENETEWHRTWKNCFPIHWQEIVHADNEGKRHVADVKTESGWVIEFQHSNLSEEERQSRDAFYPKIIWVVDGKRRKRDEQRLIQAWEDGISIPGTEDLKLIPRHSSALLSEWAGSVSPVFFDLGDTTTLWWKVAAFTNGSAYVLRYPRAQFIANQVTADRELANKFDEMLTEFPRQLISYERQKHLLMVTRMNTQNLSSPRHRWASGHRRTPRM
jgi:competence protein CoiA